MTPRFLDVADTAAYLGDTVRHVRELVYTRQIPFTKVGGKLRFDLRELDRWLAENTTEVAS